jgi:hypothetical protein
LAIQDRDRDGTIIHLHEVTPEYDWIHEEPENAQVA